MRLSILESVEEVQDLSVLWINKVHRERSGKPHLIMWYQIARLITVQIGLLLGCFCSIAVATIGYVAAMVLVKIKEEEVGSRVKFSRPSCMRSWWLQGRGRRSATRVLPRQEFARNLCRGRKIRGEEGQIRPAAGAPPGRPAPQPAGPVHRPVDRML